MWLAIPEKNVLTATDQAINNSFWSKIEWENQKWPKKTPYDQKLQIFSKFGHG